MNDLSLNTTTPKLDLSETNNDLQSAEEFDELAMLCSGNFKSSDNKKLSFGELKSLCEEENDKDYSSDSNQSDQSVKK